jgi:hypothetical protein
MKYKVDDAVWYDDNLGIVVSGYPGYPTFCYDVWWVEAHKLESGVWESDLIPHDEYNVG